MIQEDTYKTITDIAEGIYTEKRSKFIAIAIPVLIVAYKAAAAEAIAAADIVERTVDEEITVSFEYPFMNDIMRIVKEDEPAILEQSYDMDCLMRLRIRKSMMGKLRARLEKVETARIIE